MVKHCEVAGQGAARARRWALCGRADGHRMGARMGAVRATAGWMYNSGMTTRRWDIGAEMGWRHVGRTGRRQ